MAFLAIIFSTWFSMLNYSSFYYRRRWFFRYAIEGEPILSDNQKAFFDYGRFKFIKCKLLIDYLLIILFASTIFLLFLSSGRGIGPRTPFIFYFTDLKFAFFADLSKSYGMPLLIIELILLVLNFLLIFLRLWVIIKRCNNNFQKSKEEFYRTDLDIFLNKVETARERMREGKVNLNNPNFQKMIIKIQSKTNKNLLFKDFKTSIILCMNIIIDYVDVYLLEKFFTCEVKWKMPFKILMIYFSP